MEELHETRYLENTPVLPTSESDILVLDILDGCQNVARLISDVVFRLWAELGRSVGERNHRPAVLQRWLLKLLLE